MKHTLLARLDSKISSIISELEQVQALTLAGLSISRLWAPFEKWALENKASKLIEWGAVCFNTLWDQINLDFALCCFYDPKLLPGLQRPSFDLTLQPLLDRERSTFMTLYFQMREASMKVI